MQEIEIEFKNIVTKNDFKNLLSVFTIKETDFKKQINFYFDTPDFQLKDHDSALRIRVKNGQYTLTLKQPNIVGLLETHQSISTEQFETTIDHDQLPYGIIFDQMKKSFNIDIKNCRLLGSLETNRAEVRYFDGTLVFDHSVYLGEEDFEIEYEVTDEKVGKSVFAKLFKQYNIPIQRTENKIERFFNQKCKQNEKQH